MNLVKFANSTADAAMGIISKVGTDSGIEKGVEKAVQNLGQDSKTLNAIDALGIIGDSNKVGLNLNAESQAKRIAKLTNISFGTYQG